MVSKGRRTLSEKPQEASAGNLCVDAFYSFRPTCLFAQGPHQHDWCIRSSLYAIKGMFSLPVCALYVPHLAWAWLCKWCTNLLIHHHQPQITAHNTCVHSSMGGQLQQDCVIICEWCCNCFQMYTLLFWVTQHSLMKQDILIKQIYTATLIMTNRSLYLFSFLFPFVFCLFIGLCFCFC